MERKMASVQVIKSVDPILNADSLEVVTVNGWKSVVTKREFKPGDHVIYCEIDSFLPFSNDAFKFLEPRGSKTLTSPYTNEEVNGHVLRTAKLRGQVSQGLVLPTSLVYGEDRVPEWLIGTDVSEKLGIFKYEPPIPASLTGQVVGQFPTHLVPKTDAERVQNLDTVWYELSEISWVATEKIDGTSTTFIPPGESGNIRVCSRNLELKYNEDLTSVRALKNQGLDKVVVAGYTIQCELAGPGIQKNPLDLKEPRLFVFNVFDEARLLPRDLWPHVCVAHAAPRLGQYDFPSSIEEAIAQVDGMHSVINPNKQAEGIVWHTDGIELDFLNSRGCFKAINNKYLLKQKD